MSTITIDEVKRLADLARIAITEDEAEKFTEHLKSITTYVDQLKEVDTEGVEPTIHGLDMKNVMREDKPEKWTTQEEVLKNAPDHQDSQFRVPSILE